MFDTSGRLVSEQSDEIFGVKTINWENLSWKYLSLIGDEQVISLQRTKVYVFSDYVLWFKSSQEYRNLDSIDGEPIEFEWNISQDSPHCNSATKFKIYC